MKYGGVCFYMGFLFKLINLMSGGECWKFYVLEWRKLYPFTDQGLSILDHDPSLDQQLNNNYQNSSLDPSQIKLFHT